MEKLTLHQPPGRAWGMPNMSPFCGKLETYLRIAEIPYEVAAMKPKQMPKGKIPYVLLDGRFVGDSQHIIEELERRLVAEGKPALDAGLSAHDAALARVTRRAVEEALYFIGLYLRWKDDAGYAVTRAEFRKLVPSFVVALIRRGSVKTLTAQGTGRHTRDELMAMGAADFAAIAELLGDRPFFFGDAPRTIDCTLFAFIDAIHSFPADSPLKTAVAGHANLVAYHQRIRDRWWKDLGPLLHSGHGG